MIKINTHEFTKSKKDNIYQLYIELTERCFGISRDYMDQDNYIINLEDCSGKPVLDISINIPEIIMKSFDFIDYTLEKNKNEIYIYFYEFPYEDNEIEVLDVKSKEVSVIYHEIT